jgi:hypothetical protein
LAWHDTTCPGLPDFSSYKIPKREKIYQISTNYTNCPWNLTKDRKMDQVSINLYQHLPLQDPPKFTQIWDFWFENKPSGNPGHA